jgi:hypothetical protein
MIEQSTSYALVKWYDADKKLTTFLTCIVGGEPVLPIFESTDKVDAGEAAEAHAMLRDIDPGWRVIVGSAEDTLELLEFLAPHIEHATINPPVAMKGEVPVEVEIIPLRRLLH